MSNKLSDPNFLFSILTAIVKKSGGNITITEKELENISKGDYLGMYYEPKTGERNVESLNGNEPSTA